MKFKLYLPLIVLLFLLSVIIVQSAPSKNSDSRRKKNILYFGTPAASHIAVNINIVLSIVNQGKYNVTMIIDETSEHEEFLRQRDIHVVYLPYFERQEFTAAEQSVRDIWFEQLMFGSRGQQFLQTLKQVKYDMIITEFEQSQDILARYLNPPLYIQIIGSLDPMSMERQSISSYQSSQHNQIRAFSMSKAVLFNSIDEMSQSFSHRLLNYKQMLGNEYTWYNRERLAFDMLQANSVDDAFGIVYHKKKPDLTLTFSIEAIVNPAIPVPPNHKFLYPRYKQSIQPQETVIKGRVKEFLEKNQQIILISFGTLFKPSLVQFRQILQFAQMNKKYGFIMAISNQNQQQLRTQIVDYDETLKKMNILLQPWIQQEALLSHPKTKVFLTHGGKNSIAEAIENAVPVIVHPLNKKDQAFFCEYVHMQNVGQCAKAITKQELTYSLKVIEKNDYYREKLEGWQRIMMKTKYDEDQYINYWVDYCFEVGTDHLRLDQFKRFSKLELHDLDIHVLVFAGFTLLLTALIMLLIKFVKNQCAKKK